MIRNIQSDTQVYSTLILGQQTQRRDLLFKNYEAQLVLLAATKSLKLHQSEALNRLFTYMTFIYLNFYVDQMCQQFCASKLNNYVHLTERLVSRNFCNNLTVWKSTGRQGTEGEQNLLSHWWKHNIRVAVSFHYLYFAQWNVLYYIQPVSVW